MGVGPRRIDPRYLTAFDLPGVRPASPPVTEAYVFT